MSRASSPSRRAVLRASALAVLASLTLTLAAGCAGTPQPSPTPQKVAARVNGVAIAQAQVDRVVKVGAFSGQSLTDKSALEQLISEALIREEAKRLGVSVTAKDLDARLQQVAESVGGEKTLEQQLAAADLAVSDLRLSLEGVLLGERLQAVKFEDLQATQAEARAYYQKNLSLFKQGAAVRLGMIVVKREKIAADVIKRIEAGQPFETAAYQFSVDPEIRAKRGMVGWIAESSLPKSLQAALKKVEVGHLSAPTQVGASWYVLKVFERRPAGTMSFAQAGDLIQKELTRRKQADALTKWVEQARAQAKVQIPG